jgi:hypothetical protein
MHFTRNCDCLHASFGSQQRVLLAEAILMEAGIWCRLQPGDGCEMVLVLRNPDWPMAEELLRKRGLSGSNLAIVKTS